MNYMTRTWHYLLAEPYTWIFYCFFQPTRFKRDLEGKSFLKRFVPMVRLVLPILLLSYPLALLVRISVYQPLSGNMASFFADPAWTSVVVIAGGIAIGLATEIGLGIVVALVMEIAAGIAGSVIGSIVWSMLVILAIRLTREYISINVTSGIRSNMVEGIVGGIAGGIVGSIVGGIAGGIVGSIVGGVVGITIGNTIEDAQGVLVLALVASIVGSTLESIMAGIAVSIAGGFILGIVGGTGQDIRLSVVYTAIVITIVAIGGSIESSIGNGLALALVTGVGSLSSYFLARYRLLFYPISGLSSLIAYLISRKNPLRVFMYLHHSSLYWDECVFLPLPGLKGILLIAALQSIEQTLEEINFIVAKRPQQISIAQAVSLEIIVRDMEMRDKLYDIASFPERLAQILPPKTKLIARPWVPSFVALNRASKEVYHYLSSTDWQTRGDSLEKTIANLKRVYPEDITNDSRLSEHLKLMLRIWLKLAQSELDVWEKAQERARTVEQVIASLPVTIDEADKGKNRDAFKEALEEYYKKYPNEKLVLQEESETIFYENRVQVAYAWQCWQILKKLVSSEGTLTGELLEDIVNLLASSLLNTSNKMILQAHSSAFFSTQLDVRELFGNLRLPQQLPVIVYTRSRFDENNADELRSIMKDIAPRSRLALILFFMETEYLKEALKLVEDNLQGIYAYYFIPLDHIGFSRVIGNNDSRKVFRQLLFSRYDLNLISPFSMRGPTSSSMFFGREHELLMITEHANTTDYALIGGRRIGKTSILIHLRDVRLPATGFLALYQDCGYTSSQAELVEAVTKERSWFADPPDPKPLSFASVIQALPDDKPLVILLDEVDNLIIPDQSAGYPLFATLRAFANAGRCHFVFSGAQSLRGEMRNSESPLYNFANEMLIGCLELRAVRELVIRPIEQLGIEIVDGEETVQRIWNFTSGHPSIVQRLCQRLLERLNRNQVLRLTVEDVEAVLIDYSFLRYDFLDIYWEQATALERLCSLAMARDRRLRTLTAVYEALNHLGLNTTLNQVNETLERLVELRNILQFTPEGYEFVAKAFPEVIPKTNLLDNLIALNCESYRNETQSQRSIQ